MAAELLFYPNMMSVIVTPDPVFLVMAAPVIAPVSSRSKATTVTMLEMTMAFLAVLASYENDIGRFNSLAGG